MRWYLNPIKLAQGAGKLKSAATGGGPKSVRLKGVGQPHGIFLPRVPVRLEVVTHMREDGITLFGFLDRAEKAVFNLLRSVNGVGPKLALNILSGLPAGEIRGALAGGDVQRLVRVPGVGKKIAERLVLELRERARDEELAAGVELPTSQGERRDQEAVSALVNLGYRRADAEKVLADVAPDVPLEDAIREALRRFAR